MSSVLTNAYVCYWMHVDHFLELIGNWHVLYNKLGQMIFDSYQS